MVIAKFGSGPGGGGGGGGGAIAPLPPNNGLSLHQAWGYSCMFFMHLGLANGKLAYSLTMWDAFCCLGTMWRGGLGVVLDSHILLEELRTKHPEHFATLTRVKATFFDYHEEG